MSKELITNSIYKNELPGTFPIETPPTTIPGRKNLRISVTPVCNLRCGHCHNEGQPPPWTYKENLEKYEVSVDMIGQLVAVAQNFGVKTVKMTGGDFGMYRHLEELLERLGNEWHDTMSSISWGVNTNGLPLMNAQKCHSLFVHLSIK